MGKTTVAVNLALAGRAAGKKVVLVDIDPLRSASEFASGIDPTQRPSLSRRQASKLFPLINACDAQWLRHADRGYRSSA